MPGIVVIDTAKNPVDNLTRCLRVDRLSNVYKVVPIAPDETLPHEQMVAKVVAAVEGTLLTDNVVLFLVDIVVRERGGDADGIVIAQALRKRFPVIPLYLISNKFDDPAGEDIFSEASFEDVDGVLTKGYATERLSQDRLTRLLSRPRQSAIADRGREAVTDEGAPAHEHALRERFRSSVDLPALQLIASDFGPKRFWPLLNEVLLTASGTLDVMTPGRSGAVVLRMRGSFEVKGRGSTHEKMFVVKIGDNADLARREVANYLELAKTTLSRKHVPRLIEAQPVVRDGLAAFATEFESDADPLRRVASSQLWLHDAATIGARLGEVLENLYGAPERQTITVWPDFFTLDAKDVVAIGASIAELRSVIGLNTDHVSRVAALVETDGKSEPALRETRTRTNVAYLHGDLNSGNVLVSPLGDIVLIDFALRAPAPVTKDLAKLERDVVFRCVDAGSPALADWQRRPVWLELCKALMSPKVALASDDPSVVAAANFIRAVRKALSDSAAVPIRLREHLVALAHYTLKGIALPDLPIAKRALAVEFGSMLAIALASSNEDLGDL